jgi:hypothetical protein
MFCSSANQPFASTCSLRCLPWPMSALTELLAVYRWTWPFESTEPGSASNNFSFHLLIVFYQGRIKLATISCYAPHFAPKNQKLHGQCGKPCHSTRKTVVARRNRRCGQLRISFYMAICIRYSERRPSSTELNDGPVKMLENLPNRGSPSAKVFRHFGNTILIRPRTACLSRSNSRPERQHCMDNQRCGQWYGHVGCTPRATNHHRPQDQYSINLFMSTPTPKSARSYCRCDS